MTLLISFVLYIAASLLIKSRANGRNIVGQQLPTWFNVTCCASVCTPGLLHYASTRVVGSCCRKFETGQTFRYLQTDATTPNMLQLLHPLARFFMPLKESKNLDVIHE